MLAIVSRTDGSEKLVIREGTDFRGVSWLRGVDLNHRPLGYEPSDLGLTPIEINSLTGSKLAKIGRNCLSFVSKL